MATYDNKYAIQITPNTPNLRGMSTNYSNDGKTNLGGVGLGDLYELDYDRNKIEQIFNQGTDAAYAVKQKEAQIAENQFANQQFANQQSAIETLRAQRNEQIASGMARGLNAAQEQGTILGLQQQNASGALELANDRQLMADEIAAEYANNVVSALQQSNAIKQAMAGIAATLYEADMLGYTGELSAAAQMDANASDRYGSELGLEGTKYSADRDLEGTKYAADKSYAGALAQAAATKAAAATQAAATRYAASLQSQGVDYKGIIAKNTDKNGNVNWDQVKGDLLGNGIGATEADTLISGTRTNATLQQKGITSINNTSLWTKALDGSDKAGAALGLGDSVQGAYKNADVKAVVAEAQRQINNGSYIYKDDKTLYDDMKNGTFGALRKGW